MDAHHDAYIAYPDLRDEDRRLSTAYWGAVLAHDEDGLAAVRRQIEAVEEKLKHAQAAWIASLR